MIARHRRRILCGALATAILLAMSFGAVPAYAAPFVVQTLGATLTPADLAQTLTGAGVSVSNVTYTGANAGAGTFTGGAGILDFAEGVILSSGSAAGVVGPNTVSSFTLASATPGDTDLSALSGYTTYDAASLEFDFVPSGAKVYFSYVFASEEYNEYVNSSFNDVFAFFVNGTNYATVGDPPVAISVNTINNGNPYGTLPSSHPELYINNAFFDGTAPLDTQMDGLTVTLTFEAPVNPGVTNHMKLAIADASDSILDSNVFIKAGSFSVNPPEPEEPTPWCGCVRSQGFWRNDGNCANDSWMGYAFKWPVKETTWKQVFINQAIAFHNNYQMNPTASDVEFRDTYFDSDGMVASGAWDGDTIEALHAEAVALLSTDPATWDEGMTKGLKCVLDAINNGMYLWF